jgi:hypothetical protein
VLIIGEKKGLLEYKKKSQLFVFGRKNSRRDGLVPSKSFLPFPFPVQIFGVVAFLLLQISLINFPPH